MKSRRRAARRVGGFSSFAAAFFSTMQNPPAEAEGFFHTFCTFYFPTALHRTVTRLAPPGVQV